MSIRRIVGLAFLLLVIVGGVWLAKLIWGKPFNFDHFQTRVVVVEGLKSPEALSSIRMLEPYGITSHNGELDDLSLKADEEELARLKENYETLMSYADEDLTEEQRFNKRLMAYPMEQEIKNERFRYYDYPLTQLYGWHNNISSFMTGTHSVTDLEEAEYYVARLNKIRTQYEQYMEQLKKREEMGIIPPKFVLQKVENQLRPFITDDPKDNALYAAFKAKLDDLEGVSDEDKTRLLNETETAIRDVVFPVWAELLDYTIQIKNIATDEAGVWKLPDGDAYYQTQIERHTTTKMTADEIHQLGLSEVARIQGEMLALFEAEGYDTSIPFAELINNFTAEDRHYYPDTDEAAPRSSRITPRSFVRLRLVYRACSTARPRHRLK